ncbi:MAG: hypothetical protein PHI63_02080 [Patescibacteria group bacterium]|nr:hypothetical protein [Patescibacteria group bacterium]
MHWFLHGATGVLAANALPQHPELALSASFISHYALDHVPHWDPGIADATAKWRSPEVREFLLISLPDGVLTVTFALLLPLLVPSMPMWLTWGCVAAAILPDIIDGAAKLSNWPPLQAHRRLHDATHFNHYLMPVPWGWNLVIHVAMFTAMIVATYLAINANAHGSLLAY